MVEMLARELPAGRCRAPYNGAHDHGSRPLRHRQRAAPARSRLGRAGAAPAGAPRWRGPRPLVGPGRPVAAPARAGAGAGLARPRAKRVGAPPGVRRDSVRGRPARRDRPPGTRAADRRRALDGGPGGARLRRPASGGARAPDRGRRQAAAELPAAARVPAPSPAPPAHVREPRRRAPPLPPVAARDDGAAGAGARDRRPGHPPAPVRPVGLPVRPGVRADPPADRRLALAAAHPGADADRAGRAQLDPAARAGRANGQGHPVRPRGGDRQRAPPRHARRARGPGRVRARLAGRTVEGPRSGPLPRGGRGGGGRGSQKTLRRTSSRARP